ncbi:hypothetical protein OWV82_003905 [Melia azedarach]|uniref:Uncharacterized protein n=1 Tax=Melia azedarach TaxID=155640 RepID=A0ACC1YNL2_MELAZ|nr:hypothetical protein OWV82_003905 [Melia azedarach]
MNPISKNPTTTTITPTLSPDSPRFFFRLYPKKQNPFSVLWGLHFSAAEFGVGVPKNSIVKCYSAKLPPWPPILRRLLFINVIFNILVFGV